MCFKSPRLSSIACEPFSHHWPCQNSSQWLRTGYQKAHLCHVSTTPTNIQTGTDQFLLNIDMQRPCEFHFHSFGYQHTHPIYRVFAISTHVLCLQCVLSLWLWEMLQYPLTDTVLDIGWPKCLTCRIRSPHIMVSNRSHIQLLFSSPF